MSGGRVPGSPKSGLPAGSGIVKVTSGVGGLATANTDYMAALAGSGIVKVASNVPALAVAGTDYAVGLADSYYRALAIARLGLTAGDKNYGFLFDDLNQFNSSSTVWGWQLAPTGTGASQTLVAATKGGVHRILSGATANSIEDAWSNSQLISAIGTQLWWLGVRQAVSTAIDAQTIAATGLSENSAKTVMAGVFGASSTVNFRLQYDGNIGTTFADLGVAIDTAMHFFEIYCKGDSKIYYRIDEGVEASVTPASPSATSQYILSTVRNGTTATSRQLDRDFVACLFPR